MNVNCPNCNAALSLTLATATTQPPVQPPQPPQVTGARYPLAKLTDDDKKWLRVKSQQYMSDLRMVPGAHQLLEDMLTDSSGRTVWEGANIQTAINTVKNQIQAGGALYDPTFNWRGYTGPLLAVYAALVAQKRP